MLIMSLAISVQCRDIFCEYHNFGLQFARWVNYHQVIKLWSFIFFNLLSAHSVANTTIYMLKLLKFLWHAYVWVKFLQELISLQEIYEVLWFSQQC